MNIRDSLHPHGLLICLALVGLAWAAAAGAQTYDLEFMPSGPIMISENSGSVQIDTQVVGACAGSYSVNWEVSIDHNTTSDADFMPPQPAGTVVFTDVDDTANFDIQIQDDVLLEGDESFFFVLRASSMVDMDCSMPATTPGQIEYKVLVEIVDDELPGQDRFVVDDATAIEGSGVISFQIRRLDPDLSQAATVDWQLQPGTATAGVDYDNTPNSGSLIFPMGGPTSQSVDVALFDDDENEGTENFFLKLIDATTAIEDPSGFGQITDDDLPPRLSVQDLVVAEGDAENEVSVVVTLTFDDTPADPVAVDYFGVAGSAEDGSDWLLTPGTLVFPPGTTEQLIPVTILGDTTLEEDEEFFVLLQNPVGAVVTRPQARVTLSNDDGLGPVPVVSIDDAQVTEGDAGTTDVTVNVRLAEPAAELLGFVYVTEDGTAQAGLDFQGVEDGLLEFQPGVDAATITLSVFGDVEVEGDEMFRVRLSQILPGATGPPTGAPELRAARGHSEAPAETAARAVAEGDFEAVITIVDDDGTAPPAAELRVEDVVVTEGDAGTTAARFPVRLSQPQTFDVTAQYMTADGTATAGDGDYQPMSGVVTVPAGMTRAFVDVPVNGDTEVEEDEFFLLQLSGADGAQIARGEARGGIRNDDQDDGGGNGQRSVVRLLRPRPAMEGAGPALVGIERLRSDVGTVRALVRFGGGTATRGRDYEGGEQVVEWRPGQRGTIVIEVPLVDDSLREDEEFFGVRIVEVSPNADIGTPAGIRQPIVDDDTPMSLVAISDLEQSATVGGETVVEARVVRDDGDPVGGATVRWRVEGRARLGGEGASETFSISDADGIVRQPLVFARTPGPARLFAALPGTDSRLEFRFRVVGDLDSTVGEDDGDDGDIADALDQGCADEDGSFAEVCEFLFELSPEQRAAALLGLTPRQALPHQRQALRTPRNQVRNVSARLTALRGGMARSAFDQLALSIQGQGLSLGPLQDAIAASDPRTDGDLELAERVDLALRRAAGLASFDGGARHFAGPARGDDAAGSGGGSGDFDSGGESPWGMFFNGRISFGDAPQLGQRPDFEFQTEGVTLGVDRRMGTKWVLGAALGYSQSDTDVGSGLGSLDLSGLSLSFYTTYYTDRWYVDGVLTYGENEYDVERYIALPSAFRGARRLTAVGSPDATQTAANVAFGYDTRLGQALVLTGFARINWTRAEIDSYAESGALLFNLRYEDQTLDSLLGEVGIELTRPISFGWGVLQPLVRIAVLHEFDDDVDVVRARFVLGRSPRTFRLTAEPTDRDFFNVALGATATLPRGWATYFQYDTDLERDDLDLYTLSGGFRFQF